MTRITSTLLLLSLTACGSSSEGTWLIQFDYPVATTDGADSCGLDVTEWNFIDATPIHAIAQTTTDWTTTDHYDLSDSVSFLQISRSKDGSVLIWNNTPFPATSENGNNVTFEWTNSIETASTASHFIGYTCGETSTVSYTTTFDVLFDGDSMTGTLSLTDDLVNTYEESDLWTDDEINVSYNCGIPSSMYLESIEATNATTATEKTPLVYDAITNDQSETDCGGVTCTMTIEQHCSGDFTFTGFNTGLENEAAYDNLDSAGQSFGTGF